MSSGVETHMQGPDGFDVVERHRKGSIKKMQANPHLGILFKDKRGRTCGQCARNVLVDKCIAAAEHGYEVWCKTEDAEKIDAVKQVFENIDVDIEDIDMFNEDVEEELDADDLATELAELRQRLWNADPSKKSLVEEMKEAGVPGYTLPSSTRFTNLSFHGKRAGHDVTMGMQDPE